MIFVIQITLQISVLKDCSKFVRTQSVFGLPKLKIKNSLTSKDRNKKIKRQPTEWRKIFAKHIPDKRLASRIYELFYNNKKDKSIFKRAKDQNRHFSKKDTQMAKKHTKRCSTTLVK